MPIGSARVSTGEQTLDLRLDALRQAGCDKTSAETAGGANAQRPALAAVLGDLHSKAGVDPGADAGGAPLERWSLRADACSERPKRGPLCCIWGMPLAVRSEPAARAPFGT